MYEAWSANYQCGVISRKDAFYEATICPLRMRGGLLMRRPHASRPDVLDFLYAPAVDRSFTRFLGNVVAERQNTTIHRSAAGEPALVDLHRAGALPRRGREGSVSNMHKWRWVVTGVRISVLAG